MLSAKIYKRDPLLDDVHVGVEEAIHAVGQTGLVARAQTAAGSTERTLVPTVLGKGVDS